MSDPTTEGFQATPAEIEGMVRNLCAYALGEPDPVQRYLGLTQQQVLFEGMVEAIRRERGRVLADLMVSGVPVAEVAESTGLGTVVKVRKLVGAAGQAERVQEAATARKEAERRVAMAEKAAAKEAAAREAAAREAAARKAVGQGAAGQAAAGQAAAAKGVGGGRRAAAQKGARENAARENAARENAARENAGAEGVPQARLAPLPPHLAAPTAKRLLTEADRLALGLPVPAAPAVPAVPRKAEVKDEAAGHQRTSGKRGLLFRRGHKAAQNHPAVTA